MLSHLPICLSLGHVHQRFQCGQMVAHWLARLRYGREKHVVIPTYLLALGHIHQRLLPSQMIAN